MSVRQATLCSYRCRCDLILLLAGVDDEHDEPCIFNSTFPYVGCNERRNQLPPRLVNILVVCSLPPQIQWFQHVTNASGCTTVRTGTLRIRKGRKGYVCIFKWRSVASVPVQCMFELHDTLLNMTLTNILNVVSSVQTFCLHLPHFTLTFIWIFKVHANGMRYTTIPAANSSAPFSFSPLVFIL